MQVITIFSEKGGMGKTTLTAMLASYLAYEKGQRVCVMDFDYPNYQLYNIRSTELKVLVENPEGSFARMAARNAPYTVGKVNGKAAYSVFDLENIAKSLATQIKGQEGYFLLDFPGRYLENDPVSYLSANGLIDLVVMPIDSDRQSRSSALSTYFEMRQASKRNCGREQEIVYLWNRETNYERKESAKWYSDPDSLFESFGIPVVATRIHELQSLRRDATSPFFVRSTMCWPKANVARICPYVPAAFDEIIERADKLKNK